MRTRMRRSLWLSRAGLLAVTLALGGCASEEAAAPVEASEPAAGTEVERPPVNVVVTRLELRTLTERIRLSGSLEPWVDVQISTELGGAVESVGFDKGRYVRKDQLLAEIGTDLYQSAVEEAEAALTRAQATFEKAEQLFERQAVPRQDLIDATGDLDVRKAQLTQARLRLKRSTITSPIGGIAVTRDIEPGEVLAPGAPITVIQRVDRLKAVIGIPETDVAQFSVGDMATIRLDAFPDEEFEGRITFIGPATSGASRTFPADIAVANPGGSLKPGMVAEALLERRTFEDAIVVPRDAVHERDSGMVAIIMDGDRARVRSVTLGAGEGNDVMVLEGLAAGDQLVVEGHRGLVDDQRVRLVEGAR